MRCHKGWGRTRARKNREARDELRVDTSVASVHMQEIIKNRYYPAEKHPAKVVVTQAHLNNWLRFHKSHGIRNMTARKRRKLGLRLAFALRETPT